ncbi:MAG: hypothetical protein JNN24_14425 [Hyphomicrobium zavarzinii]|uniref:hypothetical protein n=1 Tax=Hyphomicrobium zavarzinii TaxID=48292 RepID=UPI001A38286B|nr:hypothetical protein [Hyphomicrobium zavarzinii]MBL8846959.1 hypothetical protein [Hyphomicrobium zavarzinii]
MRQYPPDCVSLASLAYRLELRREDVRLLVEGGVLPRPLVLAGKERWWWPAVEAALAVLSEPGASDRPPEEESDPFIQGIANLAAPRRPLPGKR